MILHDQIPTVGIMAAGGPDPVENFKVLSPLGVEEIRDGKAVRTGGIEWTIRDGVPFHAPTLAAEVRDIVAKARQTRRP